MRELIIAFVVMAILPWGIILAGVWGDPEVKLWIKLLTTVSLLWLGMAGLSVLCRVV